MSVHQGELTRRIWGVLRAAGALGAAACASEPVGDEDGFAGELAVALPGDDALGPPVLTLLSPATVEPGVYTTLRVRNARPGATVRIAYADAVGAGACPPSLSGVCLDVVGNTGLFGAGVANASGVADVVGFVPHDHPGSSLWLQAAHGGTGARESAPGSVALVAPPRTCTGGADWLTSGNYSVLYTAVACAPLPPSGVCNDPASLTSNQISALWTASTKTTMGAAFGGYTLFPYCHEDTVETACCYESNISMLAIGRPFVVDGASHCAPLIAGSGRRTVDLAARRLRGPQRRRVRDAWARAAQAEHASVAAFSRFTMQLLALGAPMALVSASAAAMADEVRHAVVAAELAGRFAGQDLSFGPLAAAVLGEGPVTLRAVLEDVVREGCIAETISAAEAAWMRDAATDPAIAAVLAGIAEDEARHAELAWAFVAWALAQDPSLRADVAIWFGEGHRHAPAPLDPDAAILAAHGQLDAASRFALAERVLADTVAPLAAALLGAREAA
jgi:hypothetical protein